MTRTKQYDMVLKYCQEHATISSYEAFAKLRVTRLAAVIFYLETKGYKFDHIFMHSVNEEGEKKRYMVYRLKSA